jgi:hypothetical protein
VRRPIPSLAGPIAPAALGAACLILPDAGGSGGWRTIPGRDEPAEEGTGTWSGTEFRQTLSFRSGGSLSLENDYGNVEIIGWDRETVDILARAAAGEAGAAPRRDLPDIEVRETERGFLVRTRTFEGPGAPPGVDFRVRVPSSVVLTGIRISQGNLTVADVFGRLDVSVDQGDLKVENFSGAVDATVGTGAADVELLDLRQEDTIAVTCRRGDIVLRLQPGVGAIVEADAPRGRVRSEFPLGVALPASAVKGWIGQGGPDILLRAPNGRIDIVKIKDPGGAVARARGN